MGGVEGTKEETQRKPTKCGHKKGAAVQVLQQAGGDRMYVFWDMQSR